MRPAAPRGCRQSRGQARHLVAPTALPGGEHKRSAHAFGLSTTLIAALAEEASPPLPRIVVCGPITTGTEAAARSGSGAERRELPPSRGRRRARTRRHREHRIADQASADGSSRPGRRRPRHAPRREAAAAMPSATASKRCGWRGTTTSSGRGRGTSCQAPSSIASSPSRDDANRTTPRASLPSTRARHDLPRSSKSASGLMSYLRLPATLTSATPASRRRAASASSAPGPAASSRTPAQQGSDALAGRRLRSLRRRWPGTGDGAARRRRRAVRPDLGFHHSPPRPTCEKATHRAGRERQTSCERRRAVKSRRRRDRRGAVREDDADRGTGLAGSDELSGGARLADRDGVDPHRAGRHRRAIDAEASRTRE